MKHPIYTEFNLDAKVGVSNLIAVTHTDDRNADVLEVSVRQNGVHIDLTGATAIARMVLHKDRDYLLSDSVPCAVSDGGNILIPFDSAVVPVQKGVIKIEVNLTQADSVLTLQFPIWVSVNGSILDSAEVTPESKGTVPELLKEAAEQLERVKDFATEAFVFESLDAALQGNPNAVPSLYVMQDAQTRNYKLVYVDSNDNLHTLSGDKTPDELGLQKKLTAGNNVEIDADGVISAKTVFAVNLTLTSWTGGVMDKTAGQIVEAYNQGKTVIFKGVFGELEVSLKAITMAVGTEDETITISAIAITEPDGTLYHVYIPRGKTDSFSLRTYNLRGIASASVDQNGTISFYDADGNLLFTISGANLVTSGNQQTCPGTRPHAGACGRADGCDRTDMAQRKLQRRSCGRWYLRQAHQSGAGACSANRAEPAVQRRSDG